MKHKWLILVALALVAIPVLSLASPAAACIAGYTPGYWKNYSQHRWVTYVPNNGNATTLNDVFIFTPASRVPTFFKNDPTLLAVLSQGGGGYYAFMRQAVAQLLNCTKKNHDTAWIIDLVQMVLSDTDGVVRHSADSFTDIRTLNVEGWKNYLESWHS